MGGADSRWGQPACRRRASLQTCICWSPPQRRGCPRGILSKESIVPTFMCFLNWTEQGAKHAKKTGKRTKPAKAAAEKLGGKVLSTYVTTGQYDVVATLDMPSGEKMAKFVTAIAASGNARTTTVRAFAPDKFAKLAADVPSFWQTDVERDNAQAIAPFLCFRRGSEE